MTDLEALMQYLRQPNTDYAYMITGPWGSGKTYFWNQLVIPSIKANKAWTEETRPIPVYISLYGIRDLNDIPRLVLLQTHPKLANAGKVISVVGRSILEFFNLEGAAGGLKVEDWLAQLSKNKRVLVCFDDLERSPLPVTEVLGQINQYVEHLGAKVVVLCNEVEIFNREDADSYRKTKEKVVRITREYIGDPKNAYDSIIKAFKSNNDFHLFLDEQQEEIIDIFNKSQLRNLRILKYGLIVLETSYEGFKACGENEKGTLSKLPLTLLPVTFEYQLGAFLAQDVVNVLTEGSRMLLTSLFSSRDGRRDDSSKIQKLATQYGLSMFSRETITSPALAELIVHGHLDVNTLKAEVEARNVRRTQEATAAINFPNNWFSLSDEEFKRSIESIIKALSAGELSRWEDLIRIMRSIGECETYDILPVDTSVIKEAFVVGLQRLRDGGAFEIVNDFEVKYVGRHLSDDRGFGDWAKEKLVVINAEIAAIQKRSEVQKAFDAIENNSELIANLMSTSQGSGFGDKPIAEFVDSKAFVAKLSMAPSASRHYLSYGITKRYESSHILTALAPDLPWLHEVSDGVKKLIAKYPHRTPTVYWLEQFNLAVEQAIGTLTDHNASSKSG